MELFSAVLLTIVVFVLLMFVVFFSNSDADLTVRFVEKYGKPTAVLKGKVVWITGASSGIGEHLAYDLAAVGCKLVLSARRETELERVKRHCTRYGSVVAEDILVLPLDVVKYETHSTAVQQVLKKYPKIDILVNNAGRSQRARWNTTQLDVDKQALAVNVLGVLSLSKAILPHFLEQQSGHFVVTSSLAGKIGAAGYGSYAGTKHALHGWFECLRQEVFHENIYVTMVCPGLTFSNNMKYAFTDTAGKALGEEMRANENRLPTGRCSQLMAIAIANKLDEAWISFNPELLYTYLTQYMPTISRAIACRVGKRRMEKIFAEMKAE